MDGIARNGVVYENIAANLAALNSLFFLTYLRILMYMKWSNMNDDQAKEWFSICECYAHVIFANDRRDHHVLLMKVITILQE